MDEETSRPPEPLRSHGIVLSGARVRLRPMSESDWPMLLAWNQDPRVAAFSDSNAYPWTRQLPKGEERLRFDHLFDPGDPHNKEFWLMARTSAPSLAGEFVRVAA